MSQNLRQALNEIENNKDIKLSPEFTANVNSFVALDDHIKEKEKELREEKKKRKEKEDYLIKYLNTVDKELIQISGGKLIKQKTENKTALKQDLIRETLKERFDDPEMINDLMDKMNSKRSVNVKVSIKREYDNKDKKEKKDNKN